MLLKLNCVRTKFLTAEARRKRAYAEEVYFFTNASDNMRK